MRRLGVFNQVSLDGYFTDKNGDMSWAHKQDAEWQAFASQNASGGGVLVFGRITYDMMASYWPTPEAHKQNPVVAEQMNKLQKIVFSRSLDTARWSNTTLIKDNIVEAVRTLKKAPGPDMVIMGSGTIVSQFSAARLIDEYQIVVNPIVLGSGRTMFDGMDGKMGLALKNSRSFSNGNVVLWYGPSA